MAVIEMKMQYFGIREKIWEPRISWFKPPKIWLFRWAYKIKDPVNRNGRHYSEDAVKKAIETYERNHPANAPIHIDGEDYSYAREEQQHP